MKTTLVAPSIPSPQPSAGGLRVRVRRLGRIPYAEGLSVQEELVAARQEGLGDDTLFLLEHPPVVTLGRGADESHLLLPRKEMAARGVEVHDTTRGGDVTYHGPGQLVGYAVLRLPPDLQDLHRLLRTMEKALIEAARELGIEAGRVEGLTGVWVGREKLAAIGMRVARWVTSHGFALNVAGDLSGFDLIVPCGIRGRGVTSLSRLLGRDVTVPEAAGAVVRGFGRAFSARMEEA